MIVRRFELNLRLDHRVKCVMIKHCLIEIAHIRQRQRFPLDRVKAPFDAWDPPFQVKHPQRPRQVVRNAPAGSCLRGDGLRRDGNAEATEIDRRRIRSDRLSEEANITIRIPNPEGIDKIARDQEIRPRAADLNLKLPWSKGAF